MCTLETKNTSLSPLCALDRQKSLKKQVPPPCSALARTTNNKPTSPPVLRSARPPPPVRRGNDNNDRRLTSSSDKINTTTPNNRPKTKSTSTLTRSVSTLLESNKCNNNNNNNNNNEVDESSWMLGGVYSSTLITESPGSIAAVRREQVALQTANRKMRIAHYGRSKSAKYYDSKVSPFIDSLANIKTTTTTSDSSSMVLERRCTSVTPNSDPLYVAYHDEEWGVPVHDDKMLFELLVLSGAQVGSDWASILRKRQDYRDAFAGFDSEIVANLGEKQMISISTQYGIDIGRVRGIVDNATRILQIQSEFGSLAKYIWGFMNGKPISPQYKFAQKIPVKTSKSESMSKDMVRRGFRTVGPSAIHSFMQAAGLTNDHLITCYRHLDCTLLAATRTSK